MDLMRFVKGQSGNPTGLPRGAGAEVGALARKHTRLAIKALVRVMRDAASPPAAVVAAASAILARGHGRPPPISGQAGDGGDEFKIEKLTDEQLQQLLERVQASSARGGDPAGA
jgi:hypothetical protein